MKCGTNACRVIWVATVRGTWPASACLGSTSETGRLLFAPATVSLFHHGLGNEPIPGYLEGSAPNVLNITQNKPFTWECIGGVGQGCAASGAYPLNVTAVPTQAVWPYVQQWNLSVQHKVSTHTVATVGYVGSKGTHLTTELQINQLEPVSAADNPFLPGMPITTAVCKGVATGSTIIGNHPRLPRPARPIPILKLPASVHRASIFPIPTVCGRLHRASVASSPYKMSAKFQLQGIADHHTPRTGAAAHLGLLTRPVTRSTILLTAPMPRWSMRWIGHQIARVRVLMSVIFSTSVMSINFPS